MNFTLRSLCSDSGGLEANEDLPGSGATSAWVIDGATQVVENTRLKAKTEAAWLTPRIAASLGVSSVKNEGAVTSLTHAAEFILNELESTNYPSDAMPPVASVGVAVLVGDQVQVATLGDVTILVRMADGTNHRIFNERFLDNEQAAVSKQHFEQGILERRDRYISGAGGYGVLSSNPGVVERIALQEGFRAASVSNILIASDGFMRLVDIYGTHDISSLLDEVDRVGVCQLNIKLREVETERKNVESFKHADDSSAIYLEVI